ncbi:hypothetical protein N4G66_44510 [Streptomyces rhizosphaerihabitans]|nr:hypothetical protein [Streptomyces rhizosphaerihabitans]MCT9011733.1 hypothetical protein [Streptomyces rhizosphaerihabitans]
MHAVDPAPRPAALVDELIATAETDGDGDRARGLARRLAASLPPETGLVLLSALAEAGASHDDDRPAGHGTVRALVYGTGGQVPRDAPGHPVPPALSALSFLPAYPEHGPDRPAGDRESGDRERDIFGSGDFDSSDRESDDYESGDREWDDYGAGDFESGDREWDDYGPGDRESGDRDGDPGSGDREECGDRESRQAARSDPPGGLIRLRFADAITLERAVAAFRAGSGPGFADAWSEPATLVLQIPGDAGVETLRSVLAVLDAAALTARSLTVHTHELDDVFAAFTGLS